MSWWFPGGFVVTLPCDREAAIAALNAAISSAKRSIYLSAGIALIIALMGVAIAASFPATGPFGGVFAVFLLVFIGFALLFPLIAYMQAKPWITYLEELRRGIENGTINVEDVCGRPIYWSGPRRYYPGP